MAISYALPLCILGMMTETGGMVVVEGVEDGPVDGRLTRMMSVISAEAEVIMHTTARKEAADAEAEGKAGDRLQLD